MLSHRARQLAGLLLLATIDIESALRLARSSEAERKRFHAGYQLTVNDPAIEQLEVITEFRRMVMIAEERIANGSWGYTVSIRNAQEALNPWNRKLTIRARIHFNPMKVYASVPDIKLFIGDLPNRLSPLKLDSTPQYALGNKTAVNPIVGATVDGIFDATAIGQRRLVVTVRGPDTLEVRSWVDFAALR